MMSFVSIMNSKKYDNHNFYYVRSHVIIIGTLELFIQKYTNINYVLSNYY